MGDRIDLDLKKFRALLEEERESLLELSSVSEGDRKPVMLDQRHDLLRRQRALVFCKAKTRPKPQ